ncbi:autotransporter assembly complex family protein [Thioalkalivibrio sp. ALE17]|uniref:autotransporter assembly complex protein TamA n=1 Tax=Thioalkalivibrio sp. ALE17 TaxID=1158173 RepID=UPI0004915BB3|nr:autotransporter assembly complex family protein [Thioalkalivibrio sp. ALE17]
MLTRAPLRNRYHRSMTRLRALFIRRLALSRVGGVALVMLALAGLASPAAAENGATPGLQIEGGTDAQRENIRNSINLARHPCDLPGFRERRVLRDTEERARNALRAIGFYDAELELDFERGEDCWDVRITLDPGPPTTVERIDIQITGEGADDLGFEAVRSQTEIRVGDTLRHDRYEALRNRMTRIAADRGYFDADLHTRRLEVDRDARAATIRLHMETGDRYRMGQVRIDQDILADDFVQRMVPFEAGDPYSSAQIIALQRNLNDSGYFGGVRVRPRRDAADGLEVPILAELEPRKRHSYEAGIGYSTDIGPRIRLRYEHRYANTRGHRYQAEIEASPVRSGIGYNYEIPLRDPLRERLNLFTTYRTEKTDTQESDRFQIGANRILQRRSGWQTTEGLRYEYEDYTAGEDDSGRSQLLIPSYRISRMDADDPMTPRRGYRFEATVQGAREEILSSTSFAQVLASGKIVRGLGPGRVLARADAGFTEVDAVQDLPSSLRFYAGGDASIRGYGYQRVGPRNEDGDVIGGRHKVVGSLEYDYPVVGNWSAAAFVDAGNVVNEWDEFDPVYGVGIGVRWRSPVGPIRVDLAHGPDSEDDFRIHFSMGPDL